MTILGAVFLPQCPPERLREVAVAADRAGLEELWLWEDCFREGGVASAAAALTSIFSAASAAQARQAGPVRSTAFIGANVETPGLQPVPTSAPRPTPAAHVPPPAPIPITSAPAPAKVHASGDVSKLKLEILRLEGLVKKLQSELAAEREYSRALEAHVKTLQEAE